MSSSPQGPLGREGNGRAIATGGEIAEKAGEEAVLFGDSRGKPGLAGDVGRK